ncbi:MAG: DegV family protein [Anaerolineae bacterium]
MAAHRVALLTDSTCDLPAEMIARYDIRVIPAYVIWDGEQLRDGVDITPSEFYRRLSSAASLPTTAAPTPDDFLRAFEEARNDGAEELVVITVSRAMSGTYQAAVNAAGQCDLPVHVIDARGSTMTIGWQVIAATRAREAGGDAAAMIAAANAARARMVQIVCPATLDYLYKGGRIGGAAHLVGSVLNIMPLVRIDHEAGIVQPGRLVRTVKRARKALLEDFIAELDAAPGQPVHIAVLHTNEPEAHRELLARVQEQFPQAEIVTNLTGPVLGLHTGPGALALAGYVEDGG